MEYLPFVVSLISGGMAGAIVNLFVTRRRQRIDAALKLLDYFFSIYGELAEVKGILQSPPTLSNPKELNRVRKIGDWFNLVASLCEKKLVDTQLLGRVGLFSEMDIFSSLVQGTHVSSDTLHKSKDWWPHLYGLDLKRLKG
jgi:hypothetical protein